MNDVNARDEGLGSASPPAAGTAATAAVLSSSPGMVLRTARQAAGVSIEALAAAMKVSVHKLEGLESDDYAALPDVVFARALAASICRVLGVDAAPVLANMPKNAAHSLSSQAASVKVTFKDGSERPRRNSLVSQATRPLGVAVLVLLLGAAVFVFLPYRTDAPESTDSESTVYEPGTERLAQELQLPAGALSDTAALQAEMPAGALSQGSATAQPPMEPGADTLRPGAVNAAPAPVPASGASNVLELTALGPSWVQVRDASKKVVLERTMVKGEVVSATGLLPLTVVVGRADAVEAKVRGSRFEFADSVKNNIARFEVQ